MNWLDSLLGEMQIHGIAPADEHDLIADGRLHRYYVDGDSPGSRNGWAVIHLDARPTAVYGSWRNGEKHVWHADAPRDIRELREHRASVKRERQQREAARKAAARDAARRAAELWRKAGPASFRNSYCFRKNVGAYGVRELNGALLVPLYDYRGRLVNLQRIALDGTKRFLKGGTVKGCYHIIGEVGERIVIAEGYATAASLHEDRGEAAAVAFCCSNILPVGLALRSAMPTITLAIMADDDHLTPGNPGMTAARAATEKLDCAWRIPPFERLHCDRPDWATDYNDFVRLRDGRFAS